MLQFSLISNIDNSENQTLNTEIGRTIGISVKRQVRDYDPDTRSTPRPCQLRLMCCHNNARNLKSIHYRRLIAFDQALSLPWQMHRTLPEHWFNIPSQ